jgi:hypothetical protein
LHAFCTYLLSCSETSDLLDEDGHLVLLDGAGTVLVELLEALLEVVGGELTGALRIPDLINRRQWCRRTIDLQAAHCFNTHSLAGINIHRKALPETMNL